jgi:hypothetical protein
VRWAGGEAELGQLGPACARGRKKADGLKVRGLWRGGGDGNWAGWRKRERGEGERDFFQTLFKFVFQTFKLPSNKKPCIQIMMHMHLLFLIYLSDI